MVYDSRLRPDHGGKDAPRQAMRKRLNAAGLLALSRRCFERIEDGTPGRTYRLVDCLMSAVAMFGLKSPSLLQLDREVRLDERVRGNLRRLYRVGSGAVRRADADASGPGSGACLAPGLPAAVPRTAARQDAEAVCGVRPPLSVVAGRHGVFASGAVRCKYCCERRHRNGTVTYHHQMLAGAIVHPDCRAVIPLAPEPIVRQDGQAKNDCERNASERFLEALRREHPHVQVIVLEGGLPGLQRTTSGSAGASELAVPDQCAGARPCGAVPASGGPFGGLVCGPERGGTRRGPPATGGSRRPAQCVPIRPSGDGVAVPGNAPRSGSGNPNANGSGSRICR